MKGVQCYELFGGIALKNHAFSIYVTAVGDPSLRTVEENSKNNGPVGPDISLVLQVFVGSNAFAHSTK